MDADNDATAIKSSSPTRAIVRSESTWIEPFLEEFRRTGVVSTSCRTIGIDPSTPYRRAKADPEFKARWDEASEEAADTIEREIFRRAVEGTEKFVVSAGRVVEYDGQPLKVREYSDSLLLALAKARRPEKFGDKVKQEITTTGTGAQIAQDPTEVKAIMMSLGAGLVSSLIGAGQPKKEEVQEDIPSDPQSSDAA